MKILLVNDAANPVGGAELMTLNLRKELRSRGHDARVFASTAGSDSSSCFADYTCFGTTSVLRTPNRVFNLSAAWKMRETLEQFRPDVVHVRMFLSQLSPLILPWLRQVPSIFHEAWYESVCPIGLKLLPDQSICQDKAGIACYRNGCLSPQAWTLLMVQQLLWQRWRHVFDRIVVNSEAVRRCLIVNGIGPVEVIWNGVRVQPPRSSLATLATVSYAGRLSWEKGVDVLIRAFAKVVKQVPDAQLLLAGDGPDRELLHNLISNLNLSSNVSMHGHLSQWELDQQLAPAWVHVVPSRFADPFPSTTAEAMMRGTAVVASNIGGLPEIVQDGETGLCVPPDNAHALAAALVTLLKNKSRIEEMGRAGRARAITHFSLKAYTDKVLSLYKSLYADDSAKKFPTA